MDKDNLIDTLKASSTLLINDIIDEVAQEISGKVPLVERLSWGTKETVAREILKDPSLLQSFSGFCDIVIYEAKTKGEDPLVTAQKIVDNATKYRAIVGVLAGVRRKVTTAIDQANTIEEIDFLIKDMTSELSTLRENIHE